MHHSKPVQFSLTGRSLFAPLKFGRLKTRSRPTSNKSSWLPPRNPEKSCLPASPPLKPCLSLRHLQVLLTLLLPIKLCLKIPLSLCVLFVSVHCPPLPARAWLESLLLISKDIIKGHTLALLRCYC